MDVEEIDMDSHRYVMIPSFINGTSYNGTLRNEFQVEVSFESLFDLWNVIKIVLQSKVNGPP